MNYLANFLTGLSLACGFVSIIFSLENHFTFSSWAIIFSVIFDGLDGQIARKNRLPDEFGKELDSLVDVISFGVAPSVLGYIFVYQQFHLWATGALFIYLVCSVSRLAKYNVMHKEKAGNYFFGLPTTASGGALASFILVYRRYTMKLPPPRSFFIFLVLLLAYLMISEVKYLNLDGIKQSFRKNKLLIPGIVLTLLVVLGGFYLKTGVFLPELAIFTLFLIYLLFSPFVLKSLNSEG